MSAAHLLCTAAAAAAWWVVDRPHARRLARPASTGVRALAVLTDLADLADDRRAPAVLASAVAAAVVGVCGPAVALAAALLAWAVAVEAATTRAERRRRTEQQAWVAGLRGLGVALAAGGSLPAALQRGGDAARAVAGGTASRALPAAAAVARVGGDPVEELARRTTSGPGRRLAAALALAASVGVAPAELADRLATAVVAEERAGRAADVALAGAAATARLLAALPVAGVGLAAAFGASAPGFLLRTPAGHGCLLTAAVLEVAGLRWSARIVANARR